MKHLALAATLLLAACTAAESTLDAPMLSYIRSNQDGTLPEQIYVYRPDATHVEVGKIVSRCENAAFVTAELDPARGQPRELVGGRIARDGSQEAFAWLAYDSEARRLHARVPAAGIDQQVAIDGEPWLIYDFDLSELNGLFYGRPPAREDFRYAVALIWPEDGAASPFRNLGFMEARYAGAEKHLGYDTLRFDVSGGLTGQLWLDAQLGHIVEARFDQPNHPGYADFRLVLQDMHVNGEEAWARVRRMHWEGCPPS